MHKKVYITCPGCGNYEYTGISNCRRCGYSLINNNTNSNNPYITPYQKSFANRMIICEKCGIGYDYKYKCCPKCGAKKPQSGLSIAAQILSLIAFFLPMWVGLGFLISLIALILGIIDLSIANKTKRHTGSYDGIFVFCIYVIILVIML